MCSSAISVFYRTRTESSFEENFRKTLHKLSETKKKKNEEKSTSLRNHLAHVYGRMVFLPTYLWKSAGTYKLLKNYMFRKKKRPVDVSMFTQVHSSSDSLNVRPRQGPNKERLKVLKWIFTFSILWSWHCREDCSPFSFFFFLFNCFFSQLRLHSLWSRLGLFDLFQSPCHSKTILYIGVANNKGGICHWGEPQRAPQLRVDLDFRHSRYIIGSAEALPILCVSDFCER